MCTRIYYCVLCNLSTRSKTKLSKCPVCNNSGASFFMAYRCEDTETKKEQQIEYNIKEKYLRKHIVTINGSEVTIMTNGVMCSRFCPHLYVKYSIDAYSEHTTDRFCGIFNVKLATDKYKRGYRCKECINKVGV